MKDSVGWPREIAANFLISVLVRYCATRSIYLPRLHQKRQGARIQIILQSWYHLFLLVIKGKRGNKYIYDDYLIEMSEFEM